MKTIVQNLIPKHKTVLFACVLALPGWLQAQPTAHYVPGAEGIKAASLPPPGWYVRDYNYFYSSDQINDASGKMKTFIPGQSTSFDASTYANIPRVIWITDTKLLGGFLGVDALIPLVNQQVTLKSGSTELFNDKIFGVGDLFAEGTLSWHLPQFDFAGGLGLWMPTGDSPTQPGPSVRPGLGFWTPMLTAGATWYIDTNRTWAVSALNRYEINSQQRYTHISPGQAYTLEWGISKTLEKVIDVGVVGYYQQQVTSDRGVNRGTGERDRAAAIGPEITLAFPPVMFFVSLRYEYEFLAESRAQGQLATLTFTKRF
jgi:hypothetical protein